MRAGRYGVSNARRSPSTETGAAQAAAERGAEMATEKLQDFRLDSIEADLKESLKNQGYMQTQLAVMQTTLERMASDHEKVVVLTEKVEKLERLLYGAIALGGAALIGLVVDVVWRAVSPTAGG